LEFDTAEEITLPVPEGQIWEVFAISFRWVSTAVVGNRLLLISIEAGNGERLYRRNCNRTQVANEAIRYTWAPGVPDEDDIAGGALAPYLMQSMPLLTISGTDAEVSISDAAGIDALDTLKGSVSLRIYSAGTF